METFWEGELKEKGWNREHQIAVLQRLHRIIKEHTEQGIGQAVGIDPFRRIIPPDIQKRYGGAYGWCVLRTLVWFGTWARANNDWVHFFFEAGDPGQKQINQAIKELYDNPIHRELLRIASWTFAAKKGPAAVIQLQPSDFIAFEGYKVVENFVTSGERPTRKSFHDLMRPDRDKIIFWSDVSLSMWRERYEECGKDVIESLIVRNDETFEVAHHKLWGYKK